MNLDLWGCGPHPWASVERTRRFYVGALASDFTLRWRAPEDASRAASAPPDAALNFSGDAGWQIAAQHPPWPLLFAMHGGAVLDHEFLAARAGVLEDSDVLIVNCSSDVAILGELFGNPAPRICRLPLPVDGATFRPATTRDACRAALGIDGGAHVLGFVARLVPQKNLHQFLHLLAELKRRLHPQPVTGVVVGSYWIDYPLLPYVTDGYPAWIADLVNRLGLRDDLAYFPAGLADDDLRLCYGAMDLLLHPTTSLDENFGYVPVEAMACGTPVVGTAYGGLKDTVRSGETGFLMPTWTTPGGIRMDLIRGLDEAERLLREPAHRERQGVGAARHARAAFSRSACGALLRSAVHQAVAARRRHRAPRPVEMRRDRPATAAAAAAAGTARAPGLLPPIQRPFASFAPVVAHYVSGPPPRVHDRLRLRVAAPLEAVGPGRWRLADAAWPAELDLDEADRRVVEQAATPILAGQLRAACGAAAGPQRLQRLVDLGVLLGSEPDSGVPAAPQASGDTPP